MRLPRPSSSSFHVPPPRPPRERAAEDGSASNRPEHQAALERTGGRSNHGNSGGTVTHRRGTVQPFFCGVEKEDYPTGGKNFSVCHLKHNRKQPLQAAMSKHAPQTAMAHWALQPAKPKQALETAMPKPVLFLFLRKYFYLQFCNTIKNTILQIL